MALLQTFLSELLVEHECVIVPGLGGFVTNKRPSTLNKRTNKLMPPSKEVGFNQRLTHNDGVLTQWVRIHEHISYDEAALKISKEVEAIKAQLAAGHQYQFDAVGVIYLNSDKNVQFVPAEERNYLSSSFGLAPITLVPVQQEEPVEEEAAITIPLVVTETTEEKAATGTKRSWRNLAAAAVFPFLIASGYLFQTGMNNPETFSAVPFSFSQEEVTSGYQPRFAEENIAFPAPEMGNPLKSHLESNPASDVIYYSFEEERISPDGVQIVLNSSAVAKPELPAKSVASTSNLKLYFIVGGAFKDAKNATDYVANLTTKGYDASVFAQSGDLHLVALGSYTSKSAAKKALESVRENENKNAWLKRQ